MSQSHRIVPARPRPELLRLYLQDHFAGLSGTLALARRAARNHQTTPLGVGLTDLADDLDRDRATLAAIMDRLDVRADRLKGVAALSAERLGRLKLNGSLLRRSPLSTLVELEGLHLGLCAKAACLRTLRRAADSDPRLEPNALDALVSRTDAQDKQLDGLRLQAAAEVFGLTDSPR